MYGIVVVVAVQNAFRLEMHQDHIFFYFKKIIFDISASKRSKNTKKILILSKKKFNFFGNAGWTTFPNRP